MRPRTILALVLALGGCAAPAASGRRATTTAVAVASDEIAAQRDAVRRERERVRELEAALGLAHAQVRQLQDELRDVRAAERTRATRIGAERPLPDTAEIVVDPPAREAGPRPVLRLYGSAPSAIPGPEAPPMVAAPPLPSIRLPVAVAPDGDPAAGVPAIPMTPIAVAPAAIAPAAAPRVVAPPPDDAAIAAYRAALAHLSGRRLDEALAGLDAFLHQHPHHAYADNALYWRGEIHYARRDYRRALTELTALVERYPRGNKVPEALLRIGLCHERMGDRQRARQVFQRLQTQYPDSVAARMASREDV